MGIISGLIGLTFIQKTTNDYNYALINYGFSQGKIGKLSIEIEKSNSSVRDIMFLSDPAKQRIAQKSLVSSLSNIDNLLKTVSASITTSEEKKILDRIKTNLVKYRQVRDTVVAKGMAAFKDETLNIFRTDGTTLMQLFKLIAVPAK